MHINSLKLLHWHLFTHSTQVHAKAQEGTHAHAHRQTLSWIYTCTHSLAHRHTHLWGVCDDCLSGSSVIILCSVRVLTLRDGGEGWGSMTQDCVCVCGCVSHKANPALTCIYGQRLEEWGNICLVRGDGRSLNECVCVCLCSQRTAAVDRIEWSTQLWY